MSPTASARHIETARAAPVQVDVREVAARTLHRPERDLGGFVLKEELFRLDNDALYEVQTFRPLNPKFDIPVTYTTPWCTDLKGFNQKFGERLGSLGMHVVAVGPELMSVPRLILGEPQRLSDAVHAQHAVLNAIETGFGGQPAYPFRPHQAISAGYSRGAMVGFGINRYSHLYGRDIRSSEYIDPCLEHAVGLADVNPFKLPIYLTREVATLVNHLREYGLADEAGLIYHALTKSPRFWLQQIRLGRTLFSGEAGQFVDGWHPDSAGHIGLFDGSIFNHADFWEERFKQFPNIKITRSPGYHLSGADPKIQARSAQTILTAQRSLR